MMESSYIYIVQIKRPLKKATLKLFKSVTPALAYLKRSLQERGSKGEIKTFDWKGGV